jgi:transcriptional regulator GlxA family with amidase domain
LLKITCDKTAGCSPYDKRHSAAASAVGYMPAVIAAISLRRLRVVYPTDHGGRCRGQISVQQSQREHYKDIVDRFFQLAQANLDKPTRIPELSRAIGVEPRQLRRACQAILGMTPVSYLNSLRLSEVRRTLSTLNGAASTITESASRFGFHELGRFAAAYRAAFGEHPSETRQKTLSNSGTTAPDA